MDDNLHNSPYVLAYRRRMQKRVVKRTKIGTLKQSLKRVSKEYCAESSICGLKHLVDDNTPWMERVIWIVVLISALIFSVSLVWLTFSKYYGAPLVTTQMPEGVSVSDIIFPAVGICTNNRISKQAITNLAQKLLKEERNSKYNESEMLSLLFGLGMLYNFQPMNMKIAQPMKLHRALGDYDVNELMRSLTPSCDDLLLRCAWNEKVMNCSDLFDFRLTMNGYCCTFNYLRGSDITFEDNIELRSSDMYKKGNKSNFDFDQGLKILMRFNDSDDFFYNMPLQGAQMQFSDAYDFPDAPSGSFAMQIISPNVQMTVMVTASFTEASRDIQHVPVKLRQCLFYDESSYLAFYTHSDCMLKCRMLFLYENCYCTPFTMPRMATTMRTCDMRDIPCLSIYNVQAITVRPSVDPMPPELEMHLAGGGINCPMCYPSCFKTAYNYDFNNVNIYPDYLNSIADKDRVDWLLMFLGDDNQFISVHHLGYCRCSYETLTTYTYQLARMNPRRQGANFTGTSIVHVKYAREVAARYGQNVIMKWFDLISNIGSTCGFITGFSFVSVLEFIYFYTVQLIRHMGNRQKAESVSITTKALESTSPRDFEPMSKYRSIYWNELAGPTR